MLERALLVAGFLLVFPLTASARQAGLPLQVEGAFGVLYARTDAGSIVPNPYGALWVGLGLPPSDYARETDLGGRAFLSAGLEATVNGSRGPFSWSLGAGQRFGRRWRTPGGPAGPFPDGYIYTRFTPFVGFARVASEEYLGEEPRVTTVGYGGRLGVGFTAAGWPATTLGSLGSLGGISSGGGNDPCSAVIAAVILALLLDHSELTYELYREPTGDLHHRFGWRLGIGF